jgi:transcriptional regulator with XRE-family HTH domain
MNKQLSIPPGAERWLINLIELYNRSDLTMKQIAEKENLAEKSVSNVLLGKSKSPSVNLVRRIIHALGGSWREIFGESDAVIGSQDLATLQAEVDRLSAMVDQLTKEKEALTYENLLLKEKVESLRYKIDDLKDDLISTLKHYQKTQED